MKLAEAIDHPDVRSGKKYLQAKGNSWPGFDWIKQWRFRVTGGNPISAFPGMLSKRRVNFECRYADDGPFLAWKVGVFEPGEINLEYELVDPA